MTSPWEHAMDAVVFDISCLRPSSCRRVLFVIVLYGWIVPNAAAAASFARIVAFSGDVQIKQLEGAWIPAIDEQRIERGTKIRTGADGTAELHLADGSQLTLRPSTQMEFSPRFRRRTAVSVKLFVGRLWSSIRKTLGGNGFQIDTPNAVAGVRGTEFETGVGVDGGARVLVSESEVAVTSGEQTQSVTTNQQIDVDESYVGSPGAAEGAGWESWQADREARLSRDAEHIVETAAAQAQSRMESLEAQREKHQELRQKRDALLQKGAPGKEIHELNEKMSEISDRMADIADQMEAQIGYMEVLIEIADDPKYGIASPEAIRQRRAGSSVFRLRSIVLFQTPSTRRRWRARKLRLKSAKTPPPQSIPPTSPSINRWRSGVLRRQVLFNSRHRRLLNLYKVIESASNFGNARLSSCNIYAWFA
ncbi:MAG: FecR domain-containing protein [Myxococcota bacterium]